MTDGLHIDKCDGEKNDELNCYLVMDNVFDFGPCYPTARTELPDGAVCYTSTRVVEARREPGGPVLPHGTHTHRFYVKPLHGVFAIVQTNEFAPAYEGACPPAHANVECEAGGDDEWFRHREDAERRARVRAETGNFTRGDRRLMTETVVDHEDCHVIWG